MKKVKVFLSMAMLAGAVAVMLPMQACSKDDTDETEERSLSLDDEEEVLSPDETEEIPSATTINGHEYVDLGLSVMWAACNVGADEPWDYGCYFAFGEITEPVDGNYSSDNCRLYHKSIYNGMAVTETNIMGNPDYDAATANWGGTWRMPTYDEISELVSKCTSTWTMLNGVNGYEVTGPNGNSIFLPAAGIYPGTPLRNVGQGGGYWSSSPDESYTYYAYYIYFNSSNFGLYYRYYRYCGQSVRPVSK